ncbi:ABC transporter substrate-binding protein [Mangrovicoccus algicola]|uniref:ABC transporter substrate-binding protein n=1 Tax=Mangrovicoccus algicola TaxID=2771008 RepID=A0A8J6Z5A6_9RHOB|nr:ABC transporter substrate-binding protein [Mangrovicoccus algicola]MBE3637959.1 ABC transporter substrate-binding protein [Mangrovicoccus algicola]
MMRSTLSVFALCAAALPGLAAADPVKVGLLLTLSGPPAVLGEHARDGALLALKKLDGKLGGEAAEFLVTDAEGKPDIAAQKARRLVESDGADVVIGPIFSNIMAAIAGPVTEGGAFLLSPNAGPSVFAGEGCNPDIFVVSYQNDQPDQVMGEYASGAGYGSVVLIAPNYQAGMDHLGGFKRTYDGDITAELMTQLGQLDYSAELAQIAAYQPDAVYAFLPGGMGVNFVKQYQQAGLSGIPMMSSFTTDETTLPAMQDAALGMLSSGSWSPDLDVPGNAEFVDDFIAEYGRVPASYAAYAYDAVMLLDTAIAAAGTEDRDALREALRTVDFPSLRGKFSFGANQFPVQDFYLTEVVQRADGAYATSAKELVTADYVDAYADACTAE